MPFLSEMYPTWNGKVKFINPDEESYRRPIGTKSFPWHPGHVWGPPVEGQNPSVSWANRFATRPMHTSVPQKYLNMVRPILDEGRPVNRSVTAGVPTSWKDWSEARSTLELPSTIKTVDGIGGGMSFVTEGSLGASDWVDMIGQDYEDYYDPSYDIMGIGRLFRRRRRRGRRRRRRGFFGRLKKARKKIIRKVRKPIIKVAAKTMRGRRGHRLALILGGPAAPLLRRHIHRAVFSRRGLVHGRIPLPKRARKVAKRIPVIRKMPGLNRGYITTGHLASKHVLIPGYAVARELKKKRRRKPPQVVAEAAVTSAKQIAAKEGHDFRQVMEQPQYQEQIEAQTLANLNRQIADLKAQLAASKLEQDIRREEINQFRAPPGTAPAVPGALPKKEILAVQQAAAVNTMDRLGLEPTRDNIKMVSKKVANQWAFNQAGEIEAAKQEENYVREELKAIQTAKSGVTKGMKVGAEWWGDEGFSPF